MTFDSFLQDYVTTEKGMSADQFRAIVFKYNLQEEVQREVKKHNLGEEVQREIVSSCDYCNMDTPYNKEVVS